MILFAVLSYNTQALGECRSFIPAGSLDVPPPPPNPLAGRKSAVINETRNTARSLLGNWFIQTADIGIGWGAKIYPKMPKSQFAVRLRTENWVFATPLSNTLPSFAWYWNFNKTKKVWGGYRKWSFSVQIKFYNWLWLNTGEEAEVFNMVRLLKLLRVEWALIPPPPRPPSSPHRFCFSFPDWSSRPVAKHTRASASSNVRFEENCSPLWRKLNTFNDLFDYSGMNPSNTFSL